MVQDAEDVPSSSETRDLADIAKLRSAQSRKIEDLPNDPEASLFPQLNGKTDERLDSGDDRVEILPVPRRNGSNGLSNDRSDPVFRWLELFSKARQCMNLGHFWGVESRDIGDSR